MANWLNKLTKFITQYWLLIIILGYLSLTLPALLDSNHFLYNLEPYPDGMLYSLSGHNFFSGRGLKLVSNWGELNNWVPPVYSLVLGMGSLLFSIPTSIYLTNVLLIILMLVCFDQLLKITTSKPLVRMMSSLALLSHFILLWLPGLPMTENITLMLLMLMILSFFIKDWKRYPFFLLSILGLTFSRYSTLPLVTMGIIIQFLITLKKLQPRQRIFWGLASLVLASISLLVLKLAQIAPLNFLTTVIQNQSPWFGTRFIIPNATTFLKMLTQAEGLFLWLNIGLTNFIFLGLFILAIILLIKNKKWTKTLTLGGLFLAQLPLQLVFYTPDARYIIYSIPLIILGIAWLMELFPQKKLLLILVVSMGILLQLFLQKSLIQQVLVNNLLGRSTAWQYKAIQHFNQSLNDQDLVITALPPFLIDTYQTTQYRPLPLSKTQEFMNKQQYIWGNDLNYDNLINTYQAWVDRGQTLYLSNAYITHHQQVIEDYEMFKKEFNLILIREGCLDSCNLYRLETK